LLTSIIISGSFAEIFQMLVVELNREPGANPGRARRCNRGRILQVCHWPLGGWEGAKGGRSGSQKTCLKNVESQSPWTRDC